MSTKFHTRYSHPQTSSIEFTEPSLTQQCFKFDCDLNNIVNGLVVPSDAQEPKPTFDNVFDPNSYETSLKQVIQANEMFEKLPASIRNRFHNDPKKLLEFVSNDNNYDEALKLGLVNSRVDSNYEIPTIEKTVEKTVKNTVISKEIADKSNSAS